MSNQTQFSGITVVVILDVHVVSLEVEELMGN